MERGRSDLKRFFFTRAEADFRSAIASDSRSANAYVGLTRALLGELPPNLRTAGDVRGILPKALCVLGIVNYKIARTVQDAAQRTARVDAAKRDFTRALSENPRSAEAYYRLGYMIHDQIAKPLIGALMVAETADMKMPVSLLPNQSGVLSVRTRYSELVEQAISYTEHALAIDPGYDEAAQQRSELLKLRAILRDNVSAQ